MLYKSASNSLITQTIRTAVIKTTFHPATGNSKATLHRSVIRKHIIAGKEKM